MARNLQTGKDWSVCCSACGTCCNTAPLLSLPELFHHQHLFIGALGIRRINQFQIGEKLGKGNSRYTASVTDCAEFEKIARDCLHRVHGGHTTGHDVLLALQGFDDPDLGRCPALGKDGRCTVYADRKPTECAAVPLEPMVPDRLQHLVLAERSADAEKRGTRCIVRNVSEGARLTIQGPVVLDEEARHALVERRREVAADKRCWGNAVFRMLAKNHFFDPAGAVRLPRQGVFVIPLAPVLSVIAGVSAPCRERCLDFLDAQLVLCESSIRTSGARKPPPDAKTLDRLRGLMRTNQTLRNALLSGQRLPKDGEQTVMPSAEVEAWLGLVKPQASHPVAAEPRNPT
jgi:hypothetical protein